MRYLALGALLSIAIATCPAAQVPAPTVLGPDAARLGLNLYAALDQAGLCHGSQITCQAVSAGAVVIHLGGRDGEVVSIQANRNQAGAPLTAFVWSQH